MARLEYRLLLILGLLAGCDRVGPPAPVELHTHPGAPTLSEQPPAPHPDRIVVAAGDTLYGLSRRYGVPVRAVIDANHLKPPYRLLAGTSLALPQVRTHDVRVGDTLASVARLHGVELSTLAASNHLEPPYVIRTGETLILPPPVERAAAPAAPAAPAEAAATPRAVVATTLPPPAPAASAEAAAAPPLPAATQSAAVPEPAVAPRPLPAVASLPAPMASPPPNAPDQTASLPAPPEAGKGFVWPVRGRIIAAYGTGPEGTHNDGINIAAPAGTPVLAAAAGEVKYSGNELRGYGNLILIKHDDGFITAYAHNDVLLVKRGDRVARGQAIAKVGATGAVSEPQLHFEIRRGMRVLDPADYLPAQAATASR